MNFLAPGWILVAGLASAIIAGFHLISWQLPREAPLPTARFVPDEPARRAARTVRLTDVALLALRVAILMAAGMALARPVFQSAPGGTARVIAVERTADTASLRQDIRAMGGADRVSWIVFDTAAHLFTDEASAISAAADWGASASLSVGLLAAIREARTLEQQYQRVDLTLLSGFDRQAFDAATLDVRALWPDSINVIRRPSATESRVPARLEIIGDDDDPVVAGIRLAEANGMVQGSSTVRRAGSDVAVGAPLEGVALLVWPRLPDDGQRVDAIHAGNATAIAHFIRAQDLPDTGRVLARWADGRPAAIEERRGAGCLRTIGFDVPDVGDFTITPAFQHLAAELLAPCGDRVSSRAAPDTLVAAIANPPAQVARLESRVDKSAANRLAAALMILAVLLSALEYLVRRRAPTIVREAAA